MHIQYYVSFKNKIFLSSDLRLKWEELWNTEVHIFDKFQIFRPFIMNLQYNLLMYNAKGNTF